MAVPTTKSGVKPSKGNREGISWNKGVGKHLLPGRLMKSL